MFSRLQGGFLHGSPDLPADSAPLDSVSHVHLHHILIFSLSLLKTELCPVYFQILPKSISDMNPLSNVFYSKECRGHEYPDFQAVRKLLKNNKKITFFLLSVLNAFLSSFCIPSDIKEVIDLMISVNK